MKTLIGLFAVACLIGLSSCNRTPAPTAPGSPNPPSQSGGSQAFSFVGYGALLDSTYYKVWSDSSWEEFDLDTTMNGTTYTVLLDNTGYEYFYGPDGYDGFEPYGGPLIMFDSTLASLPDTMVEGKTYTIGTTFSAQGVNYTLTDMEVLEDTGSVTVPFGTFSDCLHLQSTSSISGGGQSQTQTTQYWYAKGPSDIKRIYQGTGQTILMAYGVVNDQGWGVSAGTATRAPVPRKGSSMKKETAETVPQNPAFSFRRMAPAILNGIIR